MSNGLDRIAFLREPTRLAIAELCRDEALTLPEIAGDLGRPPGSLSQPKTMVDHGALVLGSRRLGADGRGGGKTFRLNPAWESVLDEARRSVGPAWPAERQDLLLIPLSDTEAAAAALSSGIPPEVEWGARVHGAGSGLILAPAPDRGGRGTLRVVQALGDIGTRVAELHLSKIMAPVELQAWCADGGSVDRGLPPGS
jgi:hypothetical protein